MSGMGRTGKPFAVQHWGVEPDLILVGKGVASGYAPLGAVIVAPHVAETFERGTGTFAHGFTYQAHPIAAAAGNAVLDVLESRHLFERVPSTAAALRSALLPLESHPHVGEIRGLGLLLGIEFVRDKTTREPFPPGDGIAEKIFRAAMEQGVLTYPSQGCVDGARGDHILLAPPFILDAAETEFLARGLATAVSRVFAD